MPEELKNITRVQISTTIPREIYNEAKLNFWPWNHLIILGVKAQKQNPQMIARFHALEENNKALQLKVKQLAVDRNKLVEQVGNLQKAAGLIDEKEEALL